MDTIEDHYIADDVWHRLVERLTHPGQDEDDGRTGRERIVWALTDAGVWPAKVRPENSYEAAS